MYKCFSYPSRVQARSKGAGITLCSGVRCRLAGCALQSTLTRQARRFPTGGGFISRCRISDCWHLQSTQSWPFKRVPGSLQSATCGGGSSGCGRERTTPRPDHGSKVLTGYGRLTPRPLFGTLVGLQFHLDVNVGRSAPLAISLSTRHSVSTPKAAQPTYL